MIAIRMVGTVVLSLLLVFNIHAGETKKVCHAEKDRKGKETTRFNEHIMKLSFCIGETTLLQSAA